jgi:nucleoside-diphosphate kinase
MISKTGMMENDFTFAIIKPNAVRTGKTGPIMAMINQAGFTISALRMVKMTKQQAEKFYEIQKEKSFFENLTDFMSSGPAVVMVLKHHDAVKEFRKLIGDTDPAKAAEGTIRKLYGVTERMNAIHGSDSLENARKEAEFFFGPGDRF